MKRRRKLLLLGLVVTVLVVGGWYGYGFFESNRFEERLAAMRADGSLRTWEDLRKDVAVPASDGAPALKAAHELRLAVGRQWTEEGYAKPYWDPDEPWTAEQRADAQRYLDEMKPCMAKLDEALEADGIGFERATPLESPALAEFMGACQLWYLAARSDPTQTHAYVDRMVRLLGRASDLSALGSIRAVFWRSMVLPLLGDGLVGGHIDRGRVDPWLASLAAEEDALLGSAGVGDRYNRAAAVWLVQAWRRGEDPTAKTRARMRAMHKQLPRFTEDGGEVSQLRTLLSHLSGLAEPPWYTRWYGRPQLQRRANELLDEIAAVPLRPWDVRRVRKAASLATEEEGRQFGNRILLQTIAALRLARTALAVYKTIETQIPPPFELRLGVAQRLGGTRPDDPISGKLFVMEERDGAVEIHCRRSAALEALDRDYAGLEGDALRKKLREDVLWWRVPAR